jgi:hypothetical protein
VNEDDEGEQQQTEDEVDYVEKFDQNTQVVINGLDVELDMSLMWLVLNLSAIDNREYTCQILNKYNHLIKINDQICINFK